MHIVRCRPSAISLGFRSHHSIQNRDDARAQGQEDRLSLGQHHEYELSILASFLWHCSSGLPNSKSQILNTTDSPCGWETQAHNLADEKMISRPGQGLDAPILPNSFCIQKALTTFSHVFRDVSPKPSCGMQ